MFGSTYLCECTFSLMKAIKSKERSSLGHDLLKGQLRAATSNIKIDFNKLSSDTDESSEMSTSSDDDSDN